MIIRKNAAFLASSLGLVAFAIGVQANARPPGDLPAAENASAVMEEGLALVEERCTACHASNLIFGQRKSPDQWAVTVYDMVDRGAILSPEETETVIQFLEQKYSLDAERPG